MLLRSSRENVVIVVCFCGDWYDLVTPLRFRGGLTGEVIGTGVLGEVGMLRALGGCRTSINLAPEYGLNVTCFSSGG